MITWLRIGASRVRGLLLGRRLDRELDEELQEHLALLIERYVGQGVSADEARYRALRQLGNTTRLQEVCRNQRGLPLVEMLLSDLRLALRSLRRSPGFTLVAVATLALGIGANTAIFSVVDAVLWKSLPLPDSERLVWGWGVAPGGADRAATSPADCLDLKARNRTFEELGFIDAFPLRFTLTGAGEPRQMAGAMVSANFLKVLAMRPALGRGLVPADEQVTVPQVALLSQASWRRDFGADPQVIGRILVLDGHAVTVVGVLPTDLSILSHADIWQPAPFLQMGMTTRAQHFLRLLGRLRPGTSLRQASRDLNAIERDLAVAFPTTNAGWQLRLESLRDALVGPVRPALLILFAAVGLVLLIACANVANLLLARMTGRQQEIGIRLALGGRSGRLIGQLMTECLLLILVGGSAGLLLGQAGVAALRALAPVDLPRAAEVRLDTSVLLFALGVSVVTALLAGLVPVVYTVWGAWQRTLRGGRSSQSRAKRRLSKNLVIAEIALSFLLLTGAGLLLGSFWRLLHLDPGFRTGGVLTAQLLLPDGAYQPVWRRTAFFRALFARLEALPGVIAAGAISELPLSGQHNDTFFRVVGRNYQPNDKDDANYHVVVGGYFQAMRIPLLAGRLFSDRDVAESPPVILVNQPFQELYLPRQNPVGLRLRVEDGSAAPREIVGVIGGVRPESLAAQPPPEMYVPYAQNASLQMNLTVRAAVPPRQLARPLHVTVGALDPAQTVSAVRSMDDVLSAALAQSRFASLLVALFGLVALLLAAVGLYGVISYGVNQRLREMGIRAALGARPGNLVRLVVFQGFGMALIGMALGGFASPFLTRLLGGLLFGLSPYDPATFATVATVIVVVAMLACLLPARRAAKHDPVTALRHV